LDNNYNRNGWIGVKAADENHIVIYGGTGHYSYTLNGGTTWINDSIITGGGGAADINHLIMFNNFSWWGTFDLDKINKTTDGGNTWILRTTA